MTAIRATPVVSDELDVHCPYRVNAPTMVQEWCSLSFLHWKFDPDVVQALLPTGVLVDTYDEEAWVGVVPFVLRIRLRRTPFIPWVSQFPEMNVRTYVQGPDGRPGIWFLSLDAARAAAVGVARRVWQLPYMWARMRVVRAGSTITYTSRRRWPAPGPRTHAVVAIGPAVEPAATTGLERFLTARFGLWSPWGQDLAFTVAEHEPWMLHRSHAVDFTTDLLEAASLPVPQGDPIVHFAEDVRARLSPRELVPAGARIDPSG